MKWYGNLQHRNKALLIAALALASLAFVLSLTAAIEQPRRVDLDGTSWKFSPVPPQHPLIAVYLDRQADPGELFPAAPESKRARLFKDLNAFYDARGHAPAWVFGRDARAAALKLAATLAAAGRHGLDPADYRADELAAAAAAVMAKRFPMPIELIELDVGLTAAFLLYADHLAGGRTGPADLARKWHLETARVDPAAVLAAALEKRRVAAVLDELTPGNEAYRGLVAMLERYRALAAAGGWPRVPEGPKIELGADADPERLRPLAARLGVEGDLDDDAAARLAARWAAETPSYDETLAAAVARFQARHGLEADGKVGRKTLAALNVTVGERLRQIEVNLERWRWLASLELPARHIQVNVPEYRLRGYDGGRPVIDMKVVVGKEDWQTPIFADAIRYLEVNPYWNVPDAIAFEEVIPVLREDPGYLAQEDMEVVALRSDAPDPASIDWSTVNPGKFPYRIRQRPGPKNALGQIKFVFPNPFEVYLHDTPAQSAFLRDRRALSHGCVRVERPLELARYVLDGEPEWTGEHVAAALASREMQRLRLSEPLPVYILYWTAFQDAGGAAHFRDDVYGHDAALAAALGAEAQDDQRTRKPRVST